MIRNGIRFISLVLAIFTILLFFLYTSTTQRMTPFGTTDQYELDVTESNVPKGELISKLNKIVDRNSAVLLKISVDPEDYENKTDIIWFGSKKPKPKGIVVEDQEIHWFDSSMKGQMISSSDIGNRPLNGDYSIKGGQMFRDELNKWAESSGAHISWDPVPSFFKLLFAYLIQNGIGNAVIATFMLLFTALISWFVIHAKSRTLRLLGGVSPNRIHMEDTMKVLWLIAPGLFAGWIIMLGYLSAAGGMEQVLMVLWQTFLVLAAIFALSGILVMVISWLVSPKTSHIAQRQIPLKRFNQLGRLARIMTIVIALLIVPTTITSAHITYRLAEEHALWKGLSKNVSLSFGDIDSLETEEMLPEAESFFNDMEDSDNLRLSLVVDRSIVMNKEEMGNYDHIIITDKAWIDAFAVGVDTQRSGGELTSVDFENLPAPLKTFLEGQLPLWTKAKTIQPEGLGFYEFTGAKFLALPQMVGLGDTTVQAERPLVILVDNPVEILRTKGFLLEAASTGNVVFSDEKQLRSALSVSPIKPYVVSIVGIADTALEQAQKFRKEATYYVLACVLILITMVFAGIMSAQLWSGENKKRIFTLHTFGKTYASIIKPAVKKEWTVLVFTVVMGSVLVFVLKHPGVSALAIVAVSVVLLYGLGSFIAFRVCSRHTFHQMCHRYY